MPKGARTLGEFRAFGEGVEMRRAGQRLPLRRFVFLGQGDPADDPHELLGTFLLAHERAGAGVPGGTLVNAWVPVSE